METTHFKHAPPCPVCRRTLDAATGADIADHVPEPGDVSICFYCFTILMFDDDMNFVEITTEQFLELPVKVRAQLIRVGGQLKEWRARNQSS